MHCAHCQGAEKTFNPRMARRELRKYQTKGPGKTTRLLVEGIKSAGVEGATLLDIGGGVDAIENELLDDGLRSAIDVDASSAYIESARVEAERQGHGGRISYKHVDFVDLAPSMPAADLVTLEKVICCSPDMRTLVRLSSAHARKLYGFVIPRGTWWMRVGIKLENFVLRLQRNPFRTFVHSTGDMDALLRANNFERHFYAKTLLWQVLVYVRQGDSGVRVAT